MLTRKVYNDFVNWKKLSSNSALLVTGARQVGKTYLVRKFAQEEYENFVEINLIENTEAAELFKQPIRTKDLLSRLSLLIPENNPSNKTLIFFDEIQACPEIMTAIKFLIDENSYDYVLSGSLLGTELQDIRSVPVGYVTEVNMYPLDFEEFCWSQNVQHETFSNVISNLHTVTTVDNFTNNHFLDLFYKYLVIGGMPDAVKV